MIKKYRTIQFYPLFFLMLLLCSFTLSFDHAFAAWSTDPEVNTPVCTEEADQSFMKIISDGAGGAFITWEDERNGNSDIYAQRINASGISQWTTNGIVICSADDSQGRPVITSDGSGGIIITWRDHRNENYDIYAQRVNASGITQWTENGIAISSADSELDYPVILSDGSGGAIITWRDYRNGFSNTDIYAQRVNSSGIPQWTVDGIAICSAVDNQGSPVISNDGSGGAIITWTDYRNGNADIYGQRVDAAGVPQWTENGITIISADADQYGSLISSDGSGGAVITWTDFRNGNADIYAQRVNASGIPQWTENGVAICTADNSQEDLDMLSDGLGGCIITWRDIRNGYSNTDIYAQKVNASGEPQWTENGKAICTTDYCQYVPAITDDHSGGAIITWTDARSDISADIYAQRVNASGILQWTPDGVAVSTNDSEQSLPEIISDGSGGAIIFFYDTGNLNYDIYTQQINEYGLLGVVQDDFPWEVFYPAFIKKK